MKKNININLAGLLFNIDDDAYQLLKEYTDSLRRHYSPMAGGEEMVNDIESRIAELFAELKTQGHEAISIDDVQNIISRIGEVSQIEADAEADDSAASLGEKGTDTQQTTFGQQANNESNYGNGTRGSDDGHSPLHDNQPGRKRFFRDGQNKLLAGVLSGCAAFFGGDLLLWRLGYVVFCLIYGSVVDTWSVWIDLTPLIIYLLLALLAPIAYTPEEQLRMRGETINPQNLADEVSRMQQQQPATQRRSIASTILLVLLALTFGFPALVTLFTFVVVVIAFMALPTGLIQAFLGTMGVNSHLIEAGLSQATPSIWMVALGGIVALGIFVYCIFHAIMSSAGSAKPMSGLQRVIWVCLFVLACLLGYVGLVRLSGEAALLGLNLNRHSSWMSSHTTYYDTDQELPDSCKNYLEAGGWKLIDYSMCHDNGRITHTGEHYSGDSTVRYFDVWHELQTPIFTIERSEKVGPGTYRVGCVARAAHLGVNVFACVGGSITKSHGTSSVKVHLGKVCIYTQDDEEEHPHHSYFSYIPADENMGGNLWRWANETPGLGDDTIHRDFSALRHQIATANQGCGYGWNYVETSKIELTDSATIYYGVTSNKTFLMDDYTEDCNWFSVCDIQLEKRE
ncbi:MAG: PspC domain-containing protein [Bacteroidaceae bacterium]|nr:PspC domain-containing protein [Bacteroidaceae bacterium]